ncbi:hypothetical protein MCELHM10_02988 [Paracoccaceae bacterium]
MIQSPQSIVVSQKCNEDPPYRGIRCAFDSLLFALDGDRRALESAAWDRTRATGKFAVMGI